MDHDGLRPLCSGVQEHASSRHLGTQVAVQNTVRFENVGAELVRRGSGDVRGMCCCGSLRGLFVVIPRERWEGTSGRLSHASGGWSVGLGWSECEKGRRGTYHKHVEREKGRKEASWVSI
jgi:hypothetical protein